MSAPSHRPRIRRRPEESEREILEAAEALLRERPYSELTVANVMARTGLGRSSFYVYFADIPDLLRTFAQHVEREFFRVSEVWLTTEGPTVDDVDAARQSIQGVVAVYVRHGPVLRALSDAAVLNKELDQIFRYGMVEHFIDAVEQRCADQHARGRIPHPVPREVCRALVLMMDRYLAETLGHTPGEDPAVVAGALHTIWARVLYSTDALPAPAPLA